MFCRIRTHLRGIKYTRRNKGKSKFTKCAQGKYSCKFLEALWLDEAQVISTRMAEKVYNSLGI